MNQPVPEELLSAYFDGEVTPEERRSVERWLQSSPDLRQQLDDTSKLSALLHSFPREAAPAELASNVHKRIEGIQQPASKRQSSFQQPAQTKSANPVASAVLSSPDLHGWRREWMAFATGMMATAASLLLFVTLQQSPRSASSNIQSNGPELAESQRVSSMRSLGVSVDANVTNGFGDTVESLDRAKFAAVTLKDSDQSVESLAQASSPSPAATSLAINPAQVAATANAMFGMNSNGIFQRNIDGETVLAADYANQSWEIQPLSSEQFLQSVKDGKVTITSSLDPSNNVAVFEFTVIDAKRFEDDFEVLLKRFAAPQFETHEKDAKEEAQTQMLAADVPESSSGKNKVEHTTVGKRLNPRRDISGTDGLVVIYVRAPGEKLSNALSEMIAKSTGNYIGSSPQLPIDLRWNQPNNFVAASNSPVNNVNLDAVKPNDSDARSDSPEVALRKETDWSDQPVQVEAVIAKNNYALANGFVVDTEAKFDDSKKLAENAKRAGLPHAMLKQNSEGHLAEPQPASTEPTSELRAESQVRSLSLHSSMEAESVVSKSENDGSGYATFHLALAGQAQPTPQRAYAASQNSAPIQQNSMVTPQFALQQNTLNYNLPGVQITSNNAMIGNGSQMPFNNNSFRSRNSGRSNNDQRLVRMLIVVKSDKANATPTP